MQKDVISASNKIERAAKLKEQINDLDYFIFTIDTCEEFPRHTKALLTRTIETVKETKHIIFGTRQFATGSHKQEIKIPTAMITDLVVLAKKQRELLMIELNLILS